MPSGLAPTSIDKPAETRSEGRTWHLSLFQGPNLHHLYPTRRLDCISRFTSVLLMCLVPSQHPNIMDTTCHRQTAVGPNQHLCDSANRVLPSGPGSPFEDHRRRIANSLPFPICHVASFLIFLASINPVFSLRSACMVASPASSSTSGTTRVYPFCLNSDVLAVETKLACF